MPQIVVAIPVRNEAALIGDCLRALALPQGADRAEILLLVNNSTDGTADLARALAPTLPCPVHVVDHEFSSDEAHAGHARRLAMSLAAAMIDPGGVLLTTDADGSVPPDWLEANLAALDAGADVVCGRAVIDPVDALRIPAQLHEDDAVEVAYGTALDRIAALMLPDPADPWPRHTEESGASIAVRREVFLAAGGVPPVPLGEDRALIAALRRAGARIRHDPLVWVTVSGRTEGRACDGMADTIRRRIVRQDPAIDDAMEPVEDRLRRLRARQRLRAAWHHSPAPEDVAADLAKALEVTRARVLSWLAQPTIHAAEAAMEAEAPVLVRRPVLRRDLAHEMRHASAVLADLAGLPAEADGIEPTLKADMPPDAT